MIMQPCGSFIFYLHLANISCIIDPCEHISIAGNDSYTCQCNKNYILAADNISCIKCAHAQSQSGEINPARHVAICNATNEKIICSGTAISDQWILTSAQCVCDSNIDKQNISIRFAKNRTSFYEDPTDLQLLVSDIYCYPGYKPNKVIVDIALIKLQLSIPLHVMRQSPPLCLGINRAIKKYFSFGQQVIIFG